MHHKIDFTEALHALEASDQEFKTMFEHGTLSAELYKPNLTDKQNPHDRDEIYIIASGEGKFALENETTNIKAGDFLFVPARATHKFMEFTSDFSTWVLFYGPKEGEKGTVKNYLT
jgi:mannose-6-phosphate isomerase-like protein (cupin superfamily)